MKREFENRNIIITGGSSGIGKETARKLVGLGANIFIIARTEEKCLQLINELADHQKNVQYFLADVSNFEDIKKLADNFQDNKIELHGLINSAGVAEPGVFGEMSIEKYHWQMDTNYFGTVHSIMAFLPLMNNGAFIVNIASIASYLGVYGYTAYGASKFALRGFTDVLRSELKPKGIQVSIVFPPDTKTPQLEYESQFKPYVTKKLAGSAKAMDPEKVADEIINGICRRQYLIFPGFESKFFYHLSNFLGQFLYPVMDLLVYQALKEQSHNKSPDSSTE
jgi:3-dehydrosphinganine reductase